MIREINLSVLPDAAGRNRSLIVAGTGTQTALPGISTGDAIQDHPREHVVRWGPQNWLSERGRSKETALFQHVDNPGPRSRPQQIE
jgi:hypothetical protein